MHNVSEWPKAKR